MVATMNVSPRSPLFSVSVTSVMAIDRSSSPAAGVADGEVNWMPGDTRATALLFEAGVVDGDATAITLVP